MPRFLIADDHATMRQLIIQIIRDDWPEAIFGEAADGVQLLAVVAAHPWDLVVTDITMPVINGLEALQTIKGQYPGLPVVIISIHSEKVYADRAMRSGASGFIHKPMLQQELPPAIRQLLLL
jgi:two-component system invasion response regulator UvrY